MIRVEVKTSNERFEDIVRRIKKQGGSVPAFIIESVLFREQYLINNPDQISSQLDVSEFHQKGVNNQEMAKMFEAMKQMIGYNMGNFSSNMNFNPFEYFNIQQGTNRPQQHQNDSKSNSSIGYEDLDTSKNDSEVEEEIDKDYDGFVEEWKDNSRFFDDDDDLD